MAMASPVELEVVPGLQRQEPLPPPIDIGKFHGRLRLLQHRLGISVSQMARDLGVPTPTLNTWMHGVTPRDPDGFEVATRIAQTYAKTGEFEQLRGWLAWGPSATRRYADPILNPGWFNRQTREGYGEGYGEGRRAS